MSALDPADDVTREEEEPTGGLEGLPARLAEVVQLLEPIDFDTALKTIEDETLPGDPAERQIAVRNRADRAELVRAFLALRQTGRAIVRRLEDDAEGRVRSE